MRQNILTVLLCLLILAVVPPFSGCSKQTGHVVAKVGDREILIEDIDAIIAGAGFRFASAENELEIRQALIDTLINRDLLIIGAYEKNLDYQEEVLRVIDGEKNKFLLDVLFEERIIARAEPSEAEIKDWYVRIGEEIKASHILVDSESVAREVLAKLKEGVSFEELAVKYSIDPSVKRNQGDLGWFTWGTMVDNFQEAVFRMQPGEVSAPVKSEFGYHIIKLVDRRKVEHRPEYAEAKDQIRSMIIERRKRSLMQEYAEELKEKYPITVEKATCQFVLKKLEFLYPPMIGNKPRWRNNIDPAQLDQDEHALVLGLYDGGELTLGDYLLRLRRIPEENRPDFDNYDSLAEIIFRMSFMDILVLEAKDMGIENNEKYKKKLKLFKEMTMADIMRNDSIPYNLDITEDDIQAYYEAHPEEFTAPLRFHLLEIQVAEEEKAKKYKNSIRSEAEFQKIAARETLRPGKRQNSGNLGVVLREQYPALFEAAENLKRGHIAGPVRTMGKYSIVWVKQKLEPELQSLDMSKKKIIETITRQKSDSLCGEWLAKMRKRIPVETYEDVLINSVEKGKYVQADTLQSE